MDSYHPVLNQKKNNDPILRKITVVRPDWQTDENVFIGRWSANVNRPMTSSNYQVE